MTAKPHDLWLEAQRRGLRLEPAGDKLAVIPKGACPPDFADLLREHKGELLAWLCRVPCPGWRAVPPDNLPLVPVMPRPTPVNRERVISYVFRQGDGRPCPLYAWTVKRECEYYDGPGRKWDCAVLAYAAARDAACWQLNRSEADVWALLDFPANESRGLRQEKT
jgi:hypothetical protein